MVTANQKNTTDIQKPKRKELKYTTKENQTKKKNKKKKSTKKNYKNN